jgi:hypothetical protein
MMDDQLYSRILWLMLQGDVPAHLRTVARPHALSPNQPDIRLESAETAAARLPMSASDRLK